MQPRYHLPEEEIAYGPACWLWDYLRRSRMSGFFLPLSGGADSSAGATIVHVMCVRLGEEIKARSDHRPALGIVVAHAARRRATSRSWPTSAP